MAYNLQNSFNFAKSRYTEVSGNIGIINGDLIPGLTTEACSGTVYPELLTVSKDRWRGDFKKRDAVWGIKEVFKSSSSRIANAASLSGDSLCFYIEPEGHGVGVLNGEAVFTKSSLQITVYDLVRGDSKTITFHDFSLPTYDVGRYLVLDLPEENDLTEEYMVIRLREVNEFHRKGNWKDLMPFPQDILPRYNDSFIQIGVYPWNYILRNHTFSAPAGNLEVAQLAQFIETQVQSGETPSEVFDNRSYFPDFRRSTSGVPIEPSDKEKEYVIRRNTMALLSSQLPLLNSSAAMAPILGLGLATGPDIENQPISTVAREHSLIEEKTTSTPAMLFSLTGTPPLINTLQGLNDFSQGPSTSCRAVNPLRVISNEENPDDTSINFALFGHESLGISSPINTTDALKTVAANQNSNQDIVVNIAVETYQSDNNDSSSSSPDIDSNIKSVGAESSESVPPGDGLDQGLIGYFDMGNNYNSYSRLNIAPYGHGGSLLCPTQTNILLSYVPGKCYLGTFFTDSINSTHGSPNFYYDLPELKGGNKSFSFSFWFKINSPVKLTAGITSLFTYLFKTKYKPTPDSGEYQSAFSIRYYNQKLYLTYQPELTRIEKVEITSQDSIVLEKWHHVLAVFDKTRSTMFFYLDEVLQGPGIFLSVYPYRYYSNSSMIYLNTQERTTINSGKTCAWCVDELAIWKNPDWIENQTTQQFCSDLYNNGYGLYYLEGEWIPFAGNTPKMSEAKTFEQYQVQTSGTPVPSEGKTAKTAFDQVLSTAVRIQDGPVVDFVIDYGEGNQRTIDNYDIVSSSASSPKNWMLFGTNSMLSSGKTHSAIDISSDGTILLASNINALQPNSSWTGECQYSSDGGYTWDTKGAFPVYANSTNLNVLYSYVMIFTSEYQGVSDVNIPTIYKSSNSGSTWIKASCPIAPSSGYQLKGLCCSGDGSRVSLISYKWSTRPNSSITDIYYSQNGGGGWSLKRRITGVNPLSFNSLTMSYSGDKIAFTMYDSSSKKSKLHISTASGANWSERTLPSVFNGGFAYIASDPVFSKIILTGMSDLESPYRFYVYESSDLGLNWVDISPIMTPDSSVYRLYPDISGDGNTIYVAKSKYPGGDSVFYSKNKPFARNVILFIGNGMGVNHQNATSLYKTGETEQLLWQKNFTSIRDLSTSSLDGITDSAAAATALATGIQVENGVISTVSSVDATPLKTILEYANESGIRTGLVTTTSITDATMAGEAAHEVSRNNKAEIATDYLTQTRPYLMFGKGNDGISVSDAEGEGYSVVEDSSTLNSLPADSEYVSGQFSPYSDTYVKDGYDATTPRLSAMVDKAINILSNNNERFFLTIDGALIDHACHGHQEDIMYMVDEVLDFENAVQTAYDWASTRDDTLIIVLSDHETGGLDINSVTGQGETPDVTFTEPYHTDRDVKAYAWGAQAEDLNTLPATIYPNIHHVDLNSFIRSKLLTQEGRGWSEYDSPSILWSKSSDNGQNLIGVYNESSNLTFQNLCTSTNGGVTWQKLEQNWTLLDTRANEYFTPEYELKNFENNTDIGLFRYYKVSFTDNNSGISGYPLTDVLSINELVFYDDISNKTVELGTRSQQPSLAVIPKNTEGKYREYLVDEDSIVEISFTGDFPSARIRSISFAYAIDNFDFIMYVDKSGLLRSKRFDLSKLNTPITEESIIYGRVGIEDETGKISYWYSQFNLASLNDRYSISGLKAYLRRDGSGLIDIHYDLEAPFEIASAFISMYASLDNGTTWGAITSSANGDLGQDVIVGQNRHIIWNPLRDNPLHSGDGLIVKILVEDNLKRSAVGRNISGMVYIPLQTAAYISKHSEGIRKGLHDGEDVKNPLIEINEYAIEIESSSSESSVSSISSPSSRSSLISSWSFLSDQVHLPH